MSALAHLAANLQAVRIRPRAEIGIAVGVGFACFLLAFVGLAYLQARVGPPEPQAEGAPSSVGPPTGLSARIPPGRVAVSIPSSAQDVLLSEARPGDRLDVMALLPADATHPPRTVVVVRGAAVLSPAADSRGPALLEVAPDEAVVLGHLVQGGTRLTYALWSARGGPEPAAPDPPAARARPNP